MKVFIPKTNPIILHDNSYKEWQDALMFETKHCFLQQYIATDRLTFQLVMNIGGYINSRVKVYIETEDGTQTAISTLDFDASGGGTYPSAFVKKVGNNFVYVFSQLFSAFASAYVGKSFRIVVGITESIGITDEKQFKSNMLHLCSESIGTKKIHYNHIVSLQESIYGTYFNLVPYGYDLRLDCYFLQVQEKSNDEIFQAYDGSFELVSSIPYQTFELQLTENGFGLPDWFIENLAYIFKCYYKFIDGVQYQVAENGELTIDKADRYNNRFVKIELCRKELPIYNVDESPSATAYVDYDIDNRNGKITIDLPAGNYTIVADNYVFSENTFNGSAVLDFYVGKNLTAYDITTNAQIIDLASGEVVGSVQLVNNMFARGICQAEVCSDLTIMPKTDEYELPPIGQYIPPPPPPASISIVSITDLTIDGATINVSILNSMNVTKTGVEVDTDPLFSNPTTFEENGAVNSVEVDGLNSDTQYYVRAYVIDNGTTIYSDTSSSFRTLYTIPSLVIASVSSVDDDSAVINLTISNPSAYTTKTGVEIDTDPLFSNPTAFEENGVVSAVAVSGLTSLTTYYVRGYVIDNGTTIYSTNTSSFTTTAVLASITLGAISNISNVGADVAVSVSGDTSNVTKTGIEVDTDPLFSNPQTFEENGVANSISASGLTYQTTYYVRAYIIDNGNTIYSATSDSFTTLLLPAELQACEYLQTDGASWFAPEDNIFIANNITFLKTKLVINGTADCGIIGVITPNPRYFFTIQYFSNSYTFGFFCDVNHRWQPNYLTAGMELDIDIDFTNRTAVINNQYNYTITNTYYNIPYYIKIFALIVLGTPSTFLPANNGSKIWYIETNTFKLLPCYIKTGQTYTDNKGNTCTAGTAGMYDLVNNVFYTNDGTGTFTHGADI